MIFIEVGLQAKADMSSIGLSSPNWMNTVKVNTKLFLCVTCAPSWLSKKTLSVEAQKGDSF